MKTKMDNTNVLTRNKARSKKTELPGYPQYPASEDVYRKFIEKRDIDPEEISKLKEFNENWKKGANNEKDFNDDRSGSDLDVPGSEVDDQMELIMNEDEENSFYSLGGDGHNNLDED